MTTNLLLTALVLLDRLIDKECPEIEAAELVCEIDTLQLFMAPADAAYFRAILDVLDYARTN